MKLNSDGHILTTVVDGTTLTGVFADDGSINAYDATSSTTYVGVYHPCGALNFTEVDGTSFTGHYAANGSINVVNDSTHTGLYHPCGAWNVSGLATAITLSDAATLAAGETNALAIDFTDDFWQPTTGFYGSAFVVDTGTPANNYDSSPTQTASSLLTYTSPSTKMTMGPSGTLRFQAHNLYSRSEEADNASWTKNGATVSANTIAAADGTTIADTITENSVTSIHELSQTLTLVNGATYALTMEIKNASGTRWVRMDAANAASTVYFDPVAGTVGTTSGGAVGAAIDLGNGWWRFTMTWTSATGSSANYGFRLTASNGGSSTYLGDGTSGVYVAKMHLRRTPSDSTYLATTSAARYSLPYEWNTSGVLQGIRVEEARTNLCLRTQDFANASWTKDNVTALNNAATSPDGTTTASQLTEASGSFSNFRCYQSLGALSGSYTISVYIKANGRDRVEIRKPDGTDSQWVRFDLTALTATDSGAGPTTTSTITDVGNGWRRCTLSVTAAAAVTSFILIQLINSTNSRSYTGNGTSGVLVWGAQVEAGAFPTSYIPTIASIVTRAADNISLSTGAFPYSATAGTFLADVTQSVETNSFSMNWLSLNDGSLNERFQLASNNTGVLNFTVVDGGATQASITGSDHNAGNHKFAAAWAANDFALYADGTQEGTDGAGTLPTPTTLNIGVRNASSDAINGLIRKIIYLPRRMTNVELQTLTT